MPVWAWGAPSRPHKKRRRTKLKSYHKALGVYQGVRDGKEVDTVAVDKGYGDVLSVSLASRRRVVGCCGAVRVVVLRLPLRAPGHETVDALRRQNRAPHAHGDHRAPHLVALRPGLNERIKERERERARVVRSRQHRRRERERNTSRRGRPSHQIDPSIDRGPPIKTYSAGEHVVRPLVPPRQDGVHPKAGAREVAIQQVYLQQRPLFEAETGEEGEESASQPSCVCGASSVSGPSRLRCVAGGSAPGRYSRRPCSRAKGPGAPRSRPTSPPARRTQSRTRSIGLSPARPFRTPFESHPPASCACGRRAASVSVETRPRPAPSSPPAPSPSRRPWAPTRLPRVACLLSRRGAGFISRPSSSR